MKDDVIRRITKAYSEKKKVRVLLKGVEISYFYTVLLVFLNVYALNSYS